MVRPLAHKPAKLTLSSVSQAHLALAQRPGLRASLADLAQRVDSALAERLGAPVHLELELIASAIRGSNSLVSPGLFAMISLDEVGGFAVVEVEAGLASALVDRLAGGPGEPTAPHALSESEDAGSSLLVLDVLAALRKTPLEKALGPRLLRVVHAAADVAALTDLRPAHLAVRARVSCGTASGLVRVLIPASALRFWLETSPVERPAMAPELAGSNLPFAVCTEAVGLSADDLGGLAAGDVVLLDQLHGPLDLLSGPTQLVGTAFAMSGHIAADGFHLEALRKLETTMSPVTEEMKAPELPVDVEIELTTVRLSLGELGGIQAGGVIPLRISAGEPVQLKVAGQTVAIAELVDIEGQIGARILRLSK